MQEERDADREAADREGETDAADAHEAVELRELNWSMAASSCKAGICSEGKCTHTFAGEVERKVEIEGKRAPIKDDCSRNDSCSAIRAIIAIVCAWGVCRCCFG